MTHAFLMNLCVISLVKGTTLAQFTTMVSLPLNKEILKIKEENNEADIKQYNSKELFAYYFSISFHKIEMQDNVN